MEILQNAINWCKGEILSAKLILVFSAVMFVLGFLVYKLGYYSEAKSMFVPLLSLGLFFGIIGGSLLYRNPRRLVTFPEHFACSPQEFVQVEKFRIQAFMNWHPVARVLFGILGCLGIAFYIGWSDPLLRSISMALIVATLAVFVIVHFSEERAMRYYQSLESHQHQNL